MAELKPRRISTNYAVVYFVGHCIALFLLCLPGLIDEIGGIPVDFSELPFGPWELELMGVGFTLVFVFIIWTSAVLMIATYHETELEKGVRMSKIWIVVNCVFVALHILYIHFLLCTSRQIHWFPVGCAVFGTVCIHLFRKFVNELEKYESPV